MRKKMTLNVAPLSHICSVLVLLAAFLWAPELKCEEPVVVGVNMVNPQRLSPAQQDAMLDAMKAAGVRVIRCGVTNDDKGIDFARRVQARGIKIDFILDIKYRPNAPARDYQEKFPRMWWGHPLSSADPDQFRAYFELLLAKLEDAGITFGGFELSNEINWTAFNAEFPLPGKGATFGLKDLTSDPEAKQIAAGYLQYLKLLAILRDVRDHSKLNRHTPVILAGLADSGPVGFHPNVQQPDLNLDSVNANATIQFMREHGLDKLVDYYAIHTYPWNRGKHEDRVKLAQRVLAECQPAGSAAGKPCWVTEWGVSNYDASCPANEKERGPILKDMMSIFREYAEQRRLAGVVYYVWASDAWDKGTDPLSVYRCGSLTDSGRIVLDPKLLR